MLPKVRHIFTDNNLNTKTNSSNSDDDNNNIYTETLLYIVHVDEIELISDQIQSSKDKKELNKIARKISKRTTASFNEPYSLTNIIQTPKTKTSSTPSISFSNPFRRLNHLLKTTDKSRQSPSTPNLNVTPLCSSTTKKASRLFNAVSQPLFPPPPSDIFSDNPIIHASGPGLKDGFANDNCHFDLNAPEVDLQNLVIAIDGPSKADIQIEIIEKEIYRVYYKCESSGKYQISITYNGKHADGSPYHLLLRDQSVQDRLVPLPDGPIRTFIEPMEFYVNNPCIVNVRPEIPCTIFQAYIQAPEGNVNLPIIVHKSAKSERYEIFFIPKICGNHWLNVHLNQMPIIDNPYRLIVRSFSSMKSLVNSKQELFHAYTGELSQFFVSKSANDASVQTKKFSVCICGPTTTFINANETEYGYEFYYKPTKHGKYFMKIKIEGEAIQGSPFILRVHNKVHENRMTTCETFVPSYSNNHYDIDKLRHSMTGSASQICVFGTGLYEAKKRKKATFKIDASQAGPGILLVGLYSPVGPCERLVIKRVMPKSAGFIYQVSYRVRKRGQYLLTILYGANVEHVPGSPFLVLVE